MSNPTDTNQASEDELRESIDALLERWRAILTYNGDGNGDEYYQSEVVDDIQEIIRTEKLKLLAEVRERVVGEDVSIVGNTDANLENEDTLLYVQAKIAQNIIRAEQRATLTKLEAEL